MAHWISSKLKAAETLLQQIDQQAAESLRKNETAQFNQLSVENSPKSPETKPLIKDQLKKKAPENVVNQSITHNDKRKINVVSRSNSDINRDNKDGLSMNLNSKSNSTNGLTDSDWTELLSVPDKKGVSGSGSETRNSNGLSAIRGLKKDGKVGRFNLSVVDGKSEKVSKKGVLKSSRKSNAGLENNTKSEDVTPRTSNVQLPSSEGESDKRDSNSTLVIDDSSVTNIGITEGANDIIDGVKLHSLDDSDNSSGLVAVSREKKLELNDGEMQKREISDSTARSRTSNTMKKVSSVPSDGESNSETDTTSSSDSESEREREERRKRRQQILAERAAAKAVEAIKERENLVARLEGEKQSLEKILEERAKQQVQEASELQITMMETMEAAELEKQKHNNTRMEAFARLANLESVNADLTRSLAAVQKNLEIEVDRIAELRDQIHMKEATHEELRMKISSTQQNGDKLQAPKGFEFELEMLEEEYSFLTDKVGRMQDQAKTLETSIETTRREIENPTEVEIELKRRLNQLTDHLIQKQAQVETLSSEKAMLLLRIEAVSRSLDENKLMIGSSDFPGATSSIDDYSKLRPLFKEKMQSGQRHFGSLVRQLDSIFCAGYVYLKRNSTARIWCGVYFACLHLWVVYILMSHSPVSDDSRSGAVFSLENINNTGGI